jgi:glycosyl-4,4'-diaponeurosporenoate acyltransferase
MSLSGVIMKLFKWWYIKKFAVNIIYFILLSVLITCIFERLPAHLYYHRKWLFRERKWEKGGEFYQRVLKVKAWKKFLPELSDFVKSIFPKRNLAQFDKDYLTRFLAESCKSELTHWGIIFSTLLFYACNDSNAAAAMLAVATVLNLPYIIIQRYNRPRIIQILEHMEQHSGICPGFQSKISSLL